MQNEEAAIVAAGKDDVATLAVGAAIEEKEE